MTHVTLDPIPKEQAPVLRNLFELYVYDFSAQQPLDVGANGRFDLGPDDRWWSDEGHFPFFIRCDGKLSGFALARKGSRITEANDVMDVAEFFVLRGARGKKIGTDAAHALFDAFPGAWEIRVRQTNSPGFEFWSRILEARLGRPVASEAFSSKGIDWAVFRFGGNG